MKIEHAKYSKVQLVESLESVDEHQYPEIALKIYRLLLAKIKIAKDETLYETLGYKYNWVLDSILIRIPILGSLLSSLIFDENQVESDMYFKLKYLENLNLS